VSLLTPNVSAPIYILVVTYQLQCPKCLNTGLVRAETVIKAGTASRTYYCGGCEHQWSIADPRQPAPPPHTPLPKPRTRSYGPKRSG